MKSPAILVLTVLLAGCATTPLDRYNAAWKKANRTPFEELPPLLQKMWEKGDINKHTYSEWLGAWATEKKNREKRRVEAQKKWDALPPEQKYAIQLQEQQFMLQQQQLAMQEAQIRSQAIANATRSVSDGIYRSALIQSMAPQPQFVPLPSRSYQPTVSPPRRFTGTIFYPSGKSANYYGTSY